MRWLGCEAFDQNGCKLRRRLRAPPRNAENGSLKNQLCICAHAEAAADLRVLTLDVLAGRPEVNVGRFASTDRWCYAGQEADGTQVHILIELAADRDQ